MRISNSKTSRVGRWSVLGGLLAAVAVAAGQAPASPWGGAMPPAARPIPWDAPAAVTGEAYRYAPWTGGGAPPAGAGGYGSGGHIPWQDAGRGEVSPGQTPWGGPASPYPRYRFRDAPELKKQEAAPYPSFRPFSMEGRSYLQVPPGYGWKGGDNSAMPPPVFRPWGEDDRSPAGYAHEAPPYPALPPPFPPPWEGPPGGMDLGHPYPPSW